MIRLQVSVMRRFNGSSGNQIMRDAENEKVTDDFIRAGVCLPIILPVLRQCHSPPPGIGSPLRMNERARKTAPAGDLFEERMASTDLRALASASGDSNLPIAGMFRQ